MLDTYTRLNALTAYDTDFSEASCKHPSCASTVYMSPDPRLNSPIRGGLRMTLDTIPLNGKVNPEHVYDDRPAYTIHPSYSVHHTIPYAAMQNGQYLYYINHTLAQPFIRTLYDTPSDVVKESYVDPMGSAKDHYYRVPKTKPLNAGLSWITDSQAHREDLMSRQQYKRNQERYDVAKGYGHFIN